jgi:hypothetical protein
VVSDLQKDVVINEGAISGTLHHVTDYTGFDSELYDGHYLAIHCVVNGLGVEDYTIKIKIIGGSGNEVTLDEDGLFVGYIANTSEKIQITAKKDGYADVVKTYNLTGLTLED